MLNFKKNNSIAELSYYVRDNEKNDFLVIPSHEHIYVHALVAELLLMDDLVVDCSVGLTLLLLQMDDSFSFKISVNDVVVDASLGNISINEDEYQDKANWYKLFDRILAFLNVDEKAVFKVLADKELATIPTTGKVYFLVTDIIDKRNWGSTLELGQVYTGILDGNKIHWDDVNEQSWVFYVGQTCELVFARKCDVTGEGMNEGWVINDDSYYKYEKDVLSVLKDRCYSSIQEAYDDNYSIYYTEWDTVNDAQYKVVNGLIVEL
jgi:hypothetical protein